MGVIMDLINEYMKKHVSELLQKEEDLIVESANIVFNDGIKKEDIILNGSMNIQPDKSRIFYYNEVPFLRVLPNRYQTSLSGDFQYTQTIHVDYHLIY